jgi:hypothetical protein
MPPRDARTHLMHAFVSEGRLTSLPRRDEMLEAASAFLATRFEMARDYPEREVNAILAGDGPDHATLRRLLVDRGFLRRRAGVYRRSR